jgi:hypothetical protein
LEVVNRAEERRGKGEEETHPPSLCPFSPSLFLVGRARWERSIHPGFREVEEQLKASPEGATYE